MPQFKTIPLDKVVVPPNRQRKAVDHEYLIELSGDIQSPHGLLHPIILRNDGVTLVTGECRLRAVKLLQEFGMGFTHQGELVPDNEIPYQLLGELSPRDLRKAELSENLVRRDLSWQEKCQAMDELDQLLAEGNPQHTLTETAIEMSGVKPGTTESRMHPAKVSQAKLVAQNLHRPAVAKAKSLDEARKILTRELEAEFSAALAKNYNLDGMAGKHVIIHDSFEEALEIYPEKTFDCIISDPPYGINADSVFGDMSDLDHEYDDSEEAAMFRYANLARLGFRVCKDQAHMYLFCDPFHFSTIWGLVTRAGWWVLRAPIIWDKASAGLLPYPHHGPRRVYEVILYAIKGKRETMGVFPDVIRDIPNIKNKIHAAQKPVELYQNLLRRSCRPGDKVLDPMCGSGTIFPAATRESLLAVGIEQSDKAYATALTRIGE